MPDSDKQVLSAIDACGICCVGIFHRSLRPVLLVSRPLAGMVPT